MDTNPSKPGRPSIESIASKRNNLITAHTYHRFQNLYNLNFPVSVFEGLCAYLSTLIEWQWSIEAAQFDSFIRDFSRFRENSAQNRELPEDRSYHQWFQDQQNQLEDHTRPLILVPKILDAIRQENPFTFALAREKLVRIVNQQKNHQHPNQNIAMLINANARPSSKKQDAALASTTSDLIENTEPLYKQQDSESASVAQFQDLGPFIPERQWHSEKALRDSLGVRDKQELLAWISQDWVLDICEEYCAVQLDANRLNEQKYLDNGRDIPPGKKRTSAKFLINSSVLSLQYGNAKYVQDLVDTTNWTTDDHDIRFIVQLVRQGRCVGRWWENRCEAQHTAMLCCNAYKMLCWLRHIHRLSSGSSPSNQLQRASASHWWTLLSNARAERRRLTSMVVGVGV